MPLNVDSSFGHQYNTTNECRREICGNEVSMAQDFQYFRTPKKEKKTAVALEYTPSEEAPKVVASGQGFLADKIIDAARQENIPLHRDEKLADSLRQIEIGEYIPQELYQVVADVLIFVDAMDKIKGKVMDHKKK